jgi:hypothetical protein
VDTVLLRFIVFISLVFPLLGVFLMECGTISISLPYEGWYRTGYPNGASLAFLLYVAVVGITVLFTKQSFSLVGRPTNGLHPVLLTPT